jgi:hypothetical protein
MLFNYHVKHFSIHNFLVTEGSHAVFSAGFTTAWLLPAELTLLTRVDNWLYTSNTSSFNSHSIVICKVRIPLLFQGVS